MSTTVFDNTGVNPDTSGGAMNEEDYFPPMSILTGEGGRLMYKPVQKSKGNWDYQADLFQYTIDGKLSDKFGIRITVDGSRNQIDNRFELLDLEKDKDDV